MPQIDIDGANSKTVVDALKQSVSRYGIPSCIFSDNGPQYTSKEFKQFLSEWKIRHKTSSPHFSQSNGLAESMVKSTKSLIKKCCHSQEDMLKGLMILRNSPLKGDSSPAQLLLGHKLQDNLPLKPN